VRMLSFSNAAILRPRKLQVLATFSRETIEHSNIEAVVRQSLSEATGLALDLQMFSSDPGDATKPPGLLAGTAPIAATAGGGAAAMLTDLNNLFAALASHGGGKTAIIAAAVPQALALKLSVGPRFDVDIVASTALASGTVVALELASFVSGFGSAPEFTASKVGSVHMEDTTPSSNLTGAVPVRSLFQTDAIGLKMTLSAGWGLRASGHAQFVTGATW
jgi:hypothetical protein